MTYKLFLDDERFPVDPENWIVARSYQEAVSIVERLGAPDYVSFDNDLGSDLEGYHFAHWLIDRDIDHRILPDNFAFYVHSQNPVAADKIKTLLNNWLEFRILNPN